MPLQEGSTNAVQVFEVTAGNWVMENSWGGFVIDRLSEEPPTLYEKCYLSAENYYVYSDNNIYNCSGYSETEVSEMRENSTNELVHKRVTISFNINGGSGSTPSSQLRTWGVNNVTEPVSGLPTPPSGKILSGWTTTQNNWSTKVEFPYLAGNANQTLYAYYDTMPVTAMPTFNSAICQSSGSSKYIVFIAKNNDVAQATMFFGNSNTTPLNGGTANGGTNFAQNQIGPYTGNGSATVYIKAQATGKEASSVNSTTVSYFLCG